MTNTSFPTPSPKIKPHKQNNNKQTNKKNLQKTHTNNNTKTRILFFFYSFTLASSFYIGSFNIFFFLNSFFNHYSRTKDTFTLSCFMLHYFITDPVTFYYFIFFVLITTVELRTPLLLLHYFKTDPVIFYFFKNILHF